MLADGEVVRLDRGARSTCWARSSARRARWGSSPRSLVRVLPSPQRVETLLADFASTDAAGEAVSAIIAAGIDPGGDRDDGRAQHPGRRGRAARRPAARRRRRPAGRAGRAGGRGRGDARPGESSSARRPAPAPFAAAENEEQRAGFWRGRKAAFAAMGRLSPDYYVQDGVVPRTRLPETLRRIRELSKAARPARRQRVPRRRRQPASAGALRRARSRARPSGPSSWRRRS